MLLQSLQKEKNHVGFWRVWFNKEHSDISLQTKMPYVQKRAKLKERTTLYKQRKMKKGKLLCRKVTQEKRRVSIIYSYFFVFGGGGGYRGTRATKPSLSIRLTPGAGDQVLLYIIVSRVLWDAKESRVGAWSDRDSLAGRWLSWSSRLAASELVIDCALAATAVAAFRAHRVSFFEAFTQIGENGRHIK